VDLLRDKITVYINRGAGNPAIVRHTFSDEIKLETFPNIAIDFKKILKKVDKSGLDWIK
jgi:hypothetical protein